MLQQYKGVIKRMKHDEYTRKVFEDRQEDPLTLMNEFLKGKSSYLVEHADTIKIHIQTFMKQAALEPNNL